MSSDCVFLCGRCVGGIAANTIYLHVSSRVRESGAHQIYVQGCVHFMLALGFDVFTSRALARVASMLCRLERNQNDK